MSNGSHWGGGGVSGGFVYCWSAVGGWGGGGLTQSGSLALLTLSAVEGMVVGVLGMLEQASLSTTESPLQQCNNLAPRLS